MTTIPANAFDPNDLIEWDRLKKQLDAVKASEMLLRKKIFGCCFASPKEGTNDFALANGYVLKGDYKIDRTLDVGTFNALKAAPAEGLMSPLQQAGINPDKLVEYKPSLVLKEYRTLTDEQRKFFDQCLVIKPGAPSLKIELPAKAKRAAEAATQGEAQ